VDRVIPKAFVLKSSDEVTRKKFTGSTLQITKCTAAARKNDVEGARANWGNRHRKKKTKVGARKTGNRNGL